jgi:hypothetical protein
MDELTLRNKAKTVNERRSLEIFSIWRPREEKVVAKLGLRQGSPAKRLLPPAVCAFFTPTRTRLLSWAGSGAGASAIL